MTDHKKLIEELRAAAEEGLYDTADLCGRAADALAAPVQVDEAKLAEVTRVTLVGRAGERSAEHWDYAGVKLSVQDDGRTLKILPLRGGGR
ncbi:hypothetical protein [Leucobacter sp. M11]|uniref:hypothetical protein n=1 Tax=Leucobacter sp. M11 TaxID=2993565 RepID=UPI002D803FCC|nr:hypothetical protein [Leucobacter sp. M11]MEB4614026.1 hypothetical protein [Leucobacter sp. M11]